MRKTRTYVIGIDPGQNGGAAVIPTYSFAATEVLRFDLNTLPTFCRYLAELYAKIDLHNQINNKKSNFRYRVEVWVENPKNHPSDGKHGHRQLGERVGELAGIFAAFQIVPNWISPQKWQGALDCLTGGDKSVTREYAKPIFPFLSRTKADGTTSSTITDASADALLIALYGYLHHIPRKGLPLSVRKCIPKDIPLTGMKNARTKVGKPNLLKAGSIATRPKKKTPKSKALRHGRTRTRSKGTKRGNRGSRKA